MLSCSNFMRAGVWSALVTVKFQVLAYCLASTETVIVII